MKHVWALMALLLAFFTALGAWGAVLLFRGMAYSAYLVDTLPTENTVQTPELAAAHSTMLSGVGIIAMALLGAGAAVVLGITLQRRAASSAPAASVLVRGERFDITETRSKDGVSHHFAWRNGPANGTYGFTIGHAPAAAPSMRSEELEAHVHSFLDAFFAPGGVGTQDFPDFAEARQRSRPA